MAFGTYDVAILAGRPIRPEEYASQDDPFRWDLWKQVVDSNAIPPLYPGHIGKPCAECGIEVQVGPRQQEALTQMDEGKVLILCHVDAALQVAEASAQGGNATMHDLGNPYQPKEGA